MEPYKSWDFCKSIDCAYMGFSLDNRQRACLETKCKAYQFHQHLRDHGQILEEGSALESQLANYKDITGLSCEEYRMHREKIKEIESQLAEAQADNAALVEFVKQVEQSIWLPGQIIAKEILANPHPGDSLRKELEQLRNIETVANEVMHDWDCPTSLDDNDDHYSWCEGFGEGACPTCSMFKLKQALAQAKAVE